MDLDKIKSFATPVVRVDACKLLEACIWNAIIGAR